MLGRQADLLALQNLLTALGSSVPAGGHVNDRVKNALAAAVLALGLTPVTTGSWNDQIAGLLEQVAEGVAESAGGGPLEWAALTDVEQVDGAPSDPGGMSTTGTGFNQSTGRFTFVGAAHIQVADGFQEQVCRVTKKITDIIPGFAENPLKYRIEIGGKLSTWAHSTNALGLMLGVVDSETVDASLGGAVGGVRQAGSGQDQVHQVGATDLVGSASNTYLLDEFHVLIQFVQNGSGDYVAQLLLSGINEANGQKVGILQALTTSVLRAANLADWRFLVAYYHDAITTLAGATAICDIKLRVTELDTVPFQ